MDFSNLLTKVLPWIGAAATGNVPALITMAAKEVGEALGVEVPATAQGIGQAVASATTEQLLALKDRELAFQERMQAMGFAHVADMARLAVEEARVYADDAKDARAHFAADEKVFVLGIAVLLTFAALMGVVLWGSYKLISGDSRLNANALAIVSTLIGTVVGYAAANAQQVVSYFFGSSKGSNEKGSQIGTALSESMKQLGSRGNP